jgi:transcriptional regulator with GAF, ATPase, and Fis domain
MLINTIENLQGLEDDMPLDETIFFREATLRICGSLVIEKSLWRCLLYIKDYIPAEEAALHCYSPGMGTVTLYAIADREGGKFVNIPTAYPPEVRALMQKDEYSRGYVANRADEHPLAGPVLKAMGKGKSSVIVVRLIVEEEWLGSVSLRAEGWDKFTDGHLRLLSLLKEPFAIALTNSLRYRELLELKDLLMDDNRYLHDELQRISGAEIIGADFGLKGVMEMVRQVAPLSSPVLLLGETGTGKEVIATAIHNASPRKGGPFIKVNCGGIPETLMDSELFGHEKGAFTGALSRKRGRFERAHGGTIFLDEIGELTPEAQIRLLRVLQEKEIERLGGTEPIQLDIRVIAATHRDLQSMIEKGRFREDLYFRLQVFPIAIPPLRQRIGDMPALVQHFMQKKSREMKLAGIPSLAPGALDQLMAYRWPGNVRELENAVERALIISRGGPLTFSYLQPPVSQHLEESFGASGDGFVNLDLAMARHIRTALEMTGGKVEGKEGAAEVLGVNPGTLRHRMRKLGILFGRNYKKKLRE